MLSSYTWLISKCGVFMDENNNDDVYDYTVNFLKEMSVALEVLSQRRGWTLFSASQYEEAKKLIDEIAERVTALEKSCAETERTDLTTA
jgi:hypothetical protein